VEEIRRKQDERLAPAAGVALLDAEPASFSSGNASTIGDYEYAGPGIRLGSWLLDALLGVVTLYVGWLIWALFTADEGQTPAKRLLGLRVIREDREEPPGLLFMFFMRGLVAGWVASVMAIFTLGIIVFMPFWDSKNRNIWDAASRCVVLKD